MPIKAKAFVHAEKIRDGGSLAVTFRDEDAGEWVLFLPIDHASRGDTVEVLGFKTPVLIDADPARRPADTDQKIHSALSGPARALGWDEAEALIGQIDEPIAMDQWAARAWNHIRIVVAGHGKRPPDIDRFMPALKK